MFAVGFRVRHAGVHIDQNVVEITMKTIDRKPLHTYPCNETELSPCQELKGH